MTFPSTTGVLTPNAMDAIAPAVVGSYSRDLFQALDGSREFSAKLGGNVLGTFMELVARGGSSRGPTTVR